MKGTSDRVSVNSMDAAGGENGPSKIDASGKSISATRADDVGMNVNHREFIFMRARDQGDHERESDILPEWEVELSKIAEGRPSELSVLSWYGRWS